MRPYILLYRVQYTWAEHLWEIDKIVQFRDATRALRGNGDQWLTVLRA